MTSSELKPNAHSISVTTSSSCSSISSGNSKLRMVFKLLLFIGIAQLYLNSLHLLQMHNMFPSFLSRSASLSSSLSATATGTNSRRRLVVLTHGDFFIATSSASSPSPSQLVLRSLADEAGGVERLQAPASLAIQVVSLIPSVEDEQTVNLYAQQPHVRQVQVKTTASDKRPVSMSPQLARLARQLINNESTIHLLIEHKPNTYPHNWHTVDLARQLVRLSSLSSTPMVRILVDIVELDARPDVQSLAVVRHLSSLSSSSSPRTPVTFVVHSREHWHVMTGAAYGLTPGQLRLVAYDTSQPQLVLDKYMQIILDDGKHVREQVTIEHPADDNQTSSSVEWQKRSSDTLASWKGRRSLGFNHVDLFATAFKGRRVSAWSSSLYALYVDHELQINARVTGENRLETVAVRARNRFVLVDRAAGVDEFKLSTSKHQHEKSAHSSNRTAEDEAPIELSIDYERATLLIRTRHVRLGVYKRAEGVNVVFHGVEERAHAFGLIGETLSRRTSLSGAEAWRVPDPLDYFGHSAPGQRLDARNANNVFGMEEEVDDDFFDDDDFDLDDGYQNGTSPLLKRKLLFVEGEMFCHTGFAGVNRKMFLELYARGEWRVLARGDTKQVRVRP